VGYDAFTDALRDAFAPLADDRLGIRISSELAWVTAVAA
jgi:hypothetical protein